MNWDKAVGAQVAPEQGSGPVPTPPSPPVFSKGRDLDAARRSLEPWLAAKFDRKVVRITDFAYPAGAGVSNETILLTLDYDGPAGDDPTELVIRIHPQPDYQLFLEPEFELQYRLLEILHRHDLVKVARPYWFEPDESILGRSFFVMERLHGNVPVSMPVYNSIGWLYDATPAQRRIVWETAVTEFARIHLVPTELVEVADHPEHGVAGVEQKINYWTKCLDWTLRGEVPDIMHTIREWLLANIPATLERSLAWGDARMGNMMFGADFRLVGVNDWEQANLSGPMQDLGWWLFFDDYHSIGHGLPRLDGLGTRAETIDMWQDLTGMVAHDIGYYEALSGYELTTLAFRSIDLAERVGKMPQRPTMHFLHRTCGLIGIDVPAEFR
jgi:aminoglycoside phosphotransferase (APT) family kinase protein